MPWTSWRGFHFQAQPISPMCSCSGARSSARGLSGVFLPSLFVVDANLFDFLLALWALGPSDTRDPGLARDRAVGPGTCWYVTEPEGDVERAARNVAVSTLRRGAAPGSTLLGSPGRRSPAQGGPPQPPNCDYFRE